MLTGLKVVEAGDTVASSAAGALLARLGADVLKVPAARPRPEGSQKARLLELLDRDKQRAAAADEWEPEVGRRAAQADITIIDLSESGYWEEPALAERYTELVQRHNTGSWVSISPFGLEGPLSMRRGTELTVAAAGGMAHYMRSSLGRPMKPAGFTISIATGHFAVLAALHGLLLRRERAGAVHMDLSAQEAVVVTGVFLECAHKLFDCAGDGGAARYAAPRGLVQCGTGHIWIVVLEDRQWQGCVRAMGSPAWAEGIVTPADRQESHELIQRELTEWASLLTAREAAEALQAEGVPAAPVNSCADLLEGVGLDVRPEFFRDGLRNGERLPDLPYETIAPPDRPPPSNGRSPGRRYRLIDLTQVLVGPIATSWLGAMGIDVLKVEDPEWPDIYRRRGPFLDDEPGLERSAYFALANYSKRSHAVSLTTAEGRERLDALIESADVVVHNLLGRAERLGLTPERVQAELGSFLVSCAGYGRSVAYAGHRAYGMNVQAAGGVVYLSRDRRGQPTNLGTSWADPLASLWIAITTVAQLLRPAWERHSIDVSMVEVVAAEFAEYFSALTADGIELLADESRLDHAAPHGIYRCGGENRWISLAAECDDDWSRLKGALGSPGTLDRDAWETMAGRLADQDALDAALDDVLAEWSADEAFHALQAVGVACAPVWGAAELVSLEHLHERGLLHKVEHPVWGERTLIGLPWTVDGRPVEIGATPLLGADTSDEPSRWWSA
jgi:crotonobetainyl-CoA:carnitine CoA-transferase CaiB-like acyl-CoA transferase